MVSGSPVRRNYAALPARLPQNMKIFFRDIPLSGLEPQLWIEGIL